jgi:hypothetical protein
MGEVMCHAMCLLISPQFRAVVSHQAITESVQTDCVGRPDPHDLQDGFISMHNNTCSWEDEHLLLMIIPSVSQFSVSPASRIATF